MKNEGAGFVDEEVVVDGERMTSPDPFDLPTFCRESLARVARQLAPQSER